MSLLTLLKNECHAIVTNAVVMLTVFGGTIFYSLLYPLPYQHQTPRQQAIAVVNLDKSTLSYTLERMLDATPQAKIKRRLSSINAAKAALLNADISGFIVIPKEFYKDLLLGKSPSLAYAGDASYFLIYSAVVEGMVGASATLAGQVTLSHLLLDGVPVTSAASRVMPVRLNLKPTFNPEMGYLDYVVPAVFVLILQQTLALGCGVLGCTQRGAAPDAGGHYWQKVPPWQLLLVRTGLFIVIYYVLALYYFGFSFQLQQIHRLAQPLALITLLLPFLLTCCAIGHTLGNLLPRRELVTLVVLVSSMPLVFLAGFIWPVESIASPLLYLVDLFPCTLAIKAFVGLNQMDVSWQDIAPLWSGLWIQVALWSVIALFTTYRAAQHAARRCA